MALTLCLCAGCTASPPARPTSSTDVRAEAGFVELLPRDVVVHERAVSLAARSQIFYNFRPAESDAAMRPLLVSFNGFAADVVRAFGTGPTTVDADGKVVPNPDSLTSDVNLLYIDPRQAGFSYDVIDGRAPSAADCSQDVFNEYVDAADVLLVTMAFVRQHPDLHGAVYWLGESFAGVRIQWLLAYLRGAWALAPYRDSKLQRELESLPRERFLSGQVLLQPWLVGAAHATAIQAACRSPDLLAAVQASVPAPCAVSDACGCARAFARSAYNYTVSEVELDARLFSADAAQVSPEAAEALYGVRLESIPALHGEQRSRGFKCSSADATTPDQTALTEKLGILPAGQSYNLAYSPLTPGKGSADPDWFRQNVVGLTFLDNAQRVPALVSDGARDLVVPEAALSHALAAISSPGFVSETADQLSLHFPSGTQNLEIRHYPNAGHMVTLAEPQAFAADFRSWLARH